MYFYYRSRLTGWGSERSQVHPERALDPFSFANLVTLTVAERSLTMPALEARYPFNPVEFHSIRKAYL